MLFLSLVVAPFHYLAREDVEDGGDGRRDGWGRTCQAAGFTVAYLFLLGVLVVASLWAWQGKTTLGLDSLPSLAESLRWMVLWTSIVGLAFLLAYASHGLIAIPHGLMFGSKGVQGQIEELEAHLKKMQDRIDELELHAVSEDNLDVSHTERELLHLQGREQIITRKINRLRESAYLGLFQRFRLSASLFLKRLLGLILLFITLAIVSSCLVAGLGTTWKDIPRDIPTPLDRILASGALFSYAPPLILGVVMIYIFCAFLEGMTAFGIHIFWVKLYAIQPGHTLSEALLLLSAILVFPVYGIAGLMLKLVPYYAAYGSASACESHACEKTELFKIAQDLSEMFPYTEDIFYYAGTWGLGLITILWYGGIILGKSCKAWQDQRALVTDEEEPLL